VTRIISCPSTNFDDRREGVSPSLVILHYTGTRTAEEAKNRFCAADVKDAIGRIAPHYMIGGEGEILQFVEEEKRAWHAGRASWRGMTDINSASIGIEIWNTGHEFDLEEFFPMQIESLIDLVRGIKARWNICDENILGHSDIAPGRKIDPGEKFPWSLLARAGLGLMPDITAEDEAVGGRWTSQPGAFYAALARYGYDFTHDPLTLITEFQRHFLPHVFLMPQKVGELTLETCAALASLCRQAKIDLSSLSPA
jgi:N-acetylmuramoyl-L-alanine amidase